MIDQHVQSTPRTAALVAGFSLLMMAVLGIFANFVVLERLIVTGDAATTAANIAGADGLFRLGILGFLLVAILDIVVALALYVLLRPVSRSLALLAGWLRVAYAAILGAVLFNLVLVLELVIGADYLAAFEPDQLHAAAMFFLNAFRYGWLLGLVIFGCHLLVLGFVFVRAPSLSTILGALVMIAGAGYLIDSFANVLLANYADYDTLFLALVAGPGVVGELSLTIWLLFRGGKVPLRDNQAHHAA